MTGSRLLRIAAEPSPNRLGQRVYCRARHPWAFQPATQTRRQVWSAGAAYGYAQAQADLDAAVDEIRRLKALLAAGQCEDR